MLRARLGEIDLQLLAYGERSCTTASPVAAPAGHVLGSAQVRLAHGGQVWVASGDYKVAPDPTCAPFEPVRCDVFITESTFGLPIYRWCRTTRSSPTSTPGGRAMRAMRAPACWPATASARRSVLAGVDPSDRPIVVHGAVKPLNEAYRAAGHCPTRRW